MNLLEFFWNLERTCPTVQRLAVYKLRFCSLRSWWTARSWTRVSSDSWFNCIFKIAFFNCESIIFCYSVVESSLCKDLLRLAVRLEDFSQLVWFYFLKNRAGSQKCDFDGFDKLTQSELSANQFFFHQLNFLLKFHAGKFLIPYFINVSVDTSRWSSWDFGSSHLTLCSLFNHLEATPDFASRFRNTQMGRVTKFIRFVCRAMIRYRVQTLCGGVNRTDDSHMQTDWGGTPSRWLCLLALSHTHTHLGAQKKRAVLNKTTEVVKIASPTVRRRTQPINWHCV